MIIVKLSGGLGNQMFQYALGKHLALKNKTVLKIDLSEFEKYKHLVADNQMQADTYQRVGRFALWPFNIKPNFALPEEVISLTLTPKQNFGQKLIKKVLKKVAGLSNHLLTKNHQLTKKLWLLSKLKKNSTHIEEKEKFNFDPSILKLPDNIYLDGSWQTEKYFKDIRPIILKDFTLKEAPTGKNKELLDKILNSNSVSIHIRRGDYVSNPYFSKILDVCDLNYYQCCIDYITQKIHKPHFFLFSDDPVWAKDNLKLSYPLTIIDHNPVEKGCDDLRLMSACQHNIIANSTFSWWAAWLNQNPDKIVLAPRLWVKSKYNPKDIIPEEWIKI